MHGPKIRKYHKHKNQGLIHRHITDVTKSETTLGILSYFESELSFLWLFEDVHSWFNNARVVVIPAL
jgi:hypothetical protein